jgi:hypothetical protein
MPSLSVGISHNLGQEAAIERLKEHFTDAKQRFGQQVTDLAEQWNGNVFSFGFTTYGFRIEGTVTSAESEVTVDARLPLVAVPFKNTIEQQIRDQFGKVLS